MLLTFIGSGSLGPSMSTSPEEIERAINYIGCKHNFGNEWLRIAGAKLSSDGVQPWMYTAPEGCSVGGMAVKGDTIEEQEKNLREMIKILHKNRFQAGIHSVGERSIDVCFDQYMKCLKEDPWDARHCNIHGDLARLDTIKKVGEFCKNNVNKVCMNVQSVFIWTFADQFAKEVGAERATIILPLRAIFDAGINVANSSDFVYPNFLHGVQAAVLREAGGPGGEIIGKEQAITVPEAIMSYTINGAWQDHQENIKGSIEVGKLADFCVLDGDILTIDPHHIKDLRNVITVVGGRIVYNVA
jgi:predicted amidohydrolase YtcJ